MPKRTGWRSEGTSYYHLKAGWKGRGLRANYGANYIWHTEGGKGTKGKFVKFQFRPDPLAR